MDHIKLQVPKDVPAATAKALRSFEAECGSLIAGLPTTTERLAFLATAEIWLTEYQKTIMLGTAAYGAGG